MIKTAKKYKELLLYSIVNIFDKFLIFIIPLVALFIFKDKQLYNDIEYIFSISSILLIFLDFGIKNYLFYGYSVAQKKSIILRNTRFYFNFLIQFYVVLFLLLTIVAVSVTDQWLLYLFIIARSLYGLVIGFYAVYFRLIDKPSSIYVYSVGVSAATLIIMACVFFVGIPIHIAFIYISPLLAVLFFAFYFYSSVNNIDYNYFFRLARVSMVYSCPIIINLIMMGFMGQFGKIYAYNYLDASSMFDISIIQRVSMVIVLIHASIMGFYSKKLFISSQFTEHRNILFKYTISIIFFTLLTLLSVWLYNKFSIVQLNIALLSLFMIGTLFWCYTAYFELYFNRANMNKYIPIITVFSFLTYLSVFGISYLSMFGVSEKIDIYKMAVIYLEKNYLVGISGKIDTYKIAVMYLVSNLVGFLVTLYYLKAKKVLRYGYAS